MDQLLEAALRRPSPCPQAGLFPVPEGGRTPPHTHKKISSAAGNQDCAAPFSSGGDYISWIAGGE